MSLSNDTQEYHAFPALLYDSALLAQHNTFGLHCGVWVIDYASRQVYNVFDVMAPCEP